MVRYNARVNPKPANWSHNTLIEVIWTIIPVVILGFIAVPSIRVALRGRSNAAQRRPDGQGDRPSMVLVL